MTFVQRNVHKIHRELLICLTLSRHLQYKTNVIYTVLWTRFSRTRGFCRRGFCLHPWDGPAMRIIQLDWMEMGCQRRGWVNGTGVWFIPLTIPGPHQFLANAESTGLMPGSIYTRMHGARVCRCINVDGSEWPRRPWCKYRSRSRRQLGSSHRTVRYSVVEAIHNRTGADGFSKTAEACRACDGITVASAPFLTVQCYKCGGCPRIM